MQREYKDKSHEFDVFVIGFDPTESLIQLSQTFRSDISRWDVALPSKNMIADFGVKSQSTKLLLNEKNVIVRKDGYGQGNVAEWVEALKAY